MMIFCIIGFFYIAFASFRVLYNSNDPNRWEKFIIAKDPQMQSKYNKIAGNRFLLWLIGLGGLLLAVMMAVLLWFKKDILTFSKPVLKLGIDVILKYPLLLLVMIICVIFQFANIGAIFYAMMGIYTMGTRDDNPLDGRPYPKYSLNFWKFLLMSFFLFGAYWLTSLWNNFFDFTVAGTAINHYFKITQSTVIHPFCTGLTYHLGSIAFASLVLTPIDILRFMFGWVYDLVKVRNPNGCQKCLGAICLPLCWPYERFCIMIDDNALAMVYMIKRSFCPSGRKDHFLNRRVGASIEEMRSIGLLHSMSARFTCSLLAAFIAYFAFTNISFYATMVSNPLVPTIVSPFPPYNRF